MQKKVSGFILSIFLIAGCGYQFQGSGSVLPPDVKRVYIPLVENLSTEPGLTTTMTEALQDRFERYGVISIVDSTAEADAVLKAQIVKVKKQSRTSTSGTDSALQYETQMTVAAELKRVTGLVLWRTSNLTVSSAYGSTSGSVVTSSSDFASGGISQSNLDKLDDLQVERGQGAETLEKLSEEAARKIYDEAVAPDF